jgi:hypothetical protein
VITRISGAGGRVLTAGEMHSNLGVEGSRLALTFEDGAVGVELILIAEVDAEVSATGSHRLFVVSTCSASMAAVWSSAGFVLPSDLRAVGTASAIIVDRSVEDDGESDHPDAVGARALLRQLGRGHLHHRGARAHRTRMDARARWCCATARTRAP